MQSPMSVTNGSSGTLTFFNARKSKILVAPAVAHEAKMSFLTSRNSNYLPTNMKLSAPALMEISNFVLTLFLPILATTSQSSSAQLRCILDDGMRQLQVASCVASCGVNVTPRAAAHTTCRRPCENLDFESAGQPHNVLKDT